MSHVQPLYNNLKPEGQYISHFSTYAERLGMTIWTVMDTFGQCCTVRTNAGFKVAYRLASLWGFALGPASLIHLILTTQAVSQTFHAGLHAPPFANRHAQHHSRHPSSRSFGMLNDTDGSSNSQDRQTHIDM